MIGGMNDKDRLRAVLDDPVKYKDCLANNVAHLFPIAESQAKELTGIAESLKDSGALRVEYAEFRRDAEDWATLARRCCTEVLHIEPDPSKRVLWGISCFHGYVTKHDKEGKAYRKGGTWLAPNAGRRFLTREDAEGWMRMMFKGMMESHRKIGLEPAFRVVEVPPEPKGK